MDAPNAHSEQNAFSLTKVHERHGEVDDGLSVEGDGQVADSQVSSLKEGQTVAGFVNFILWRFYAHAGDCNAARTSIKIFITLY